MEQVYAIAAVWLALAVLSAVVASHLRISMALVEICVGMVAALAADRWFYPNALGANLDWLRFIASVGAVLLTFLAGAELDPAAMKAKLKEVLVVGLFGFLAPFLGCAAAGPVRPGMEHPGKLAGRHRPFHHVDGRRLRRHAGIRFQQDRIRQGHPRRVLRQRPGHRDRAGASFRPVHVSDRRLRRRYPWSCSACCRPITSRLIARYGNRTAAIRTKWILLVLCGLGALALWAGSEAVLPAYIAGMVLAKTVGRDHFYIRRLRTLTIGFLTPFYFLRAGSLVSLPALASAPLVFLALFAGKSASKIFGLFPVIGRFREDGKERWYYTLMMSTGLTFGTISALYGLTHKIVTQEQYSFLVATVIASAVIPTMIANAVFLPRHLLPRASLAGEEIPRLEVAAAGVVLEPSGAIEGE